MFSKKMALVVVVLLSVAATATAGTHTSEVTITGTVDSFAEWADTTPDIVAGDFTGSNGGTTINKVGEFLTLTAPKALTLWTNIDVEVTAAGTANGGIATNDQSVEATSTDTLTTSYKFTGADLGADADADYNLAAAFFAKSYTVAHVAGDGAYTLNLDVKLASDADRAHDAGNYTCSITLTATW